MARPDFLQAGIENLLKTIPDKPGVYQYFDKTGNIIYIGKAKSLRKRVLSYFRDENSLSGKLMMLVRRIADIRYIVVDNEYEALLLENNLIKKYQPRYNVMLKDDKTYPWICIKKEPFPRVFPTRNPVRDGSEYFGPYASVRMMNTLLELIRQIYPLRNCRLSLTEENIRKKKFRVCLEYHIGNCLGPCEGHQDEDAYLQTIDEIKNIIRGNISSVVQQLRQTMMKLAESLEFEKAHLVKEKLLLLEKYQSRSTVVSPVINNVDVYSVSGDGPTVYINFLKVINGAIIQAHTLEIKKKLDESPAALLTYAISDLMQKLNSCPAEIIVPVKPEVQIPGIKYTIPTRGDKKKLLLLSETNARYYRIDREKQKELVDPQRHTRRLMEQLQKDLHLKQQPLRIECFDNSNTQGQQAVSAMVVFINGRPARSEYRHFNIKTVSGPDDYASMEEVISRRYKRLLDENAELPQLIVVDGGKGQLSAAVAALESLGCRSKTDVIGIAKKLEEIYLPGDPLPLYLDKKSETLRLIQQLRDEAHRFGIGHHRKRREKATIKTVLTEIPGIGYNTAQKLLWKFRSVKAVSEAEFESLRAAVGKTKAEILTEYFQKNKQLK